MGVIPTKTEVIDLFWRAAWTGVNAFIGGLLAASTGIVDINALEAGKVAAIGALLTLVKAYASNKLGTGTGTSRETPAVGLQPVASLQAVPSGATQPEQTKPAV